MISLRPSLITEHHSVSSLNDFAQDVTPRSLELGLGIANGFDTFERASAGEDGEAPEKFLLGGADQIVTPVDRGAQSLLTLRKVASATREQLQAAGEARAHGGEGKNLHARGC